MYTLYKFETIKNNCKLLTPIISPNKTENTGIADPMINEHVQATTIYFHSGPFNLAMRVNGNGGGSRGSPSSKSGYLKKISLYTLCY